jgi:hypothetical protein
MKLDPNAVLNRLLQSGMAADEANEIVNQLVAEAEAAKAEKPPAQKKQWVILVSDPMGLITHDLAGWVLQMPEEDAPADLLERLMQCRGIYSRTVRGRNGPPPNTIGEIIEVVPPSIMKELGVWRKTPVPVSVITCGRRLPQDADDGKMELPGA